MTSFTEERVRAVEEHWTTVDGVATRYLEAGSGRPVLLIHGEGSVSEEWWDILKGLADTHRAIAVDLPGYGYTKPIPDSSPEALARFVWRFARTLDLEQPVLIGHSLGGGVAVHAALDRQDEVPALVLVGSAGMGRAINPTMVLQSVTPLGDLTKALVPLLPLGPTLLVAGVALIGAGRPWRLAAPWWASQVQAVSTPGALATTVRSQRSAIGILGQRNPLLHRLPELRMPTLVVWGVRDRLVPFWQGIAAVRRLRHGQLELFPRAGHMLPLEDSDRLLDVLRPFLAGVDGSTIEGEDAP